MCLIELAVSVVVGDHIPLKHPSSPALRHGKYMSLLYLVLIYHFVILKYPFV